MNIDTCDIPGCNELIDKNRLDCILCNNQYSLNILYHKYPYKKFKKILDEYELDISAAVDDVIEEYEYEFRLIEDTIRRYVRYEDRSILDALTENNNKRLMQFIELGGLDYLKVFWEDRVALILISIVTGNEPLDYQDVKNYNNYSDPDLEQAITNLSIIEDSGDLGRSQQKILHNVIDMDETIEYQINSIQRGVIDEYIIQEAVQEMLNYDHRISYLGDNIPRIIALISLDLRGMRISMLDRLINALETNDLKEIKHIQLFYKRLLKYFR